MVNLFRTVAGAASRSTCEIMLLVPINDGVVRGFDYEANREDKPNWHQAMNGPFADEYWKAAEKEIITLEGMGAWDVVECENDMNVMNGPWAFKCKQFLNGTVKMFNTCFCACEDQQLEAIDFFETYAPVVKWTTVCLMLIIENLLSLKSKQVDVATAFLHATLGEDEKVYVEMPLGFKQHD